MVDDAETPMVGGLRAENRRRLRERVVASAADLVRESADLSFTMPDVAERSGVALRTLYRQYPKRDDLLAALADVANQTEVLDPPDSLEDIEPWLLAAWSNLLAEEALLRAQHLGAAGAAIRQRRVAGHRAATAAVVERLRPGLAESRRDDVIDTLLLLTSSTTMFEFVDVLEVPVERAAKIAAGAVRSVLADDPPGRES